MKRERGTGSVYQTATGWRGAYVDGWGHRRYVSGRTKAHVEDKMPTRTLRKFAEQPDRMIRVSRELMDAMTTRTIEGWRVHIHWGNPDKDGFYEPTLSVDFADDLVIETLTRVEMALATLPVAKSDSTILRVRLGDVRALLQRMKDDR